TKEVINIANYPKQDFQIFQDKIYFYDVTYTADNSVQNGIGVFDMTTQNFIEEPFISDGTKIMNTPYGIGINPETEDVYVSTTNFATRGKVLIFNKEGKKTKELTVGINPNMFVFF
ncbi:YncE family protein, partial [Bacteroidales bacterium OttesenSCG-928-M06]|nr:YncE family protein [Bacteroidales bacterium OttesenSCG-928-M06]